MRRHVVRSLCASLLLAGGVAGGVVGGVASPAGASQTPASPAPGGSFHAVDGGRVFDTRTGLGGHTGRFQHYTVPVLGHRGVPSTGVSAVQVVIKVIDPTAAGYGVAWQPNRVHPNTRNVSFAPGRTSSQTSVVPVEAGSIAVYLSRAGYLIVDVTGYFTDAAHADGGGLLHTMTPTRALSGTTLAAYSRRTVKVTGGQVPPDAVAVVANLTASRPSATGALTVFATGRPTPQPQLNVQRGLSTSARTIVAVGTGGTLTIANGAGSSRAYLDITGYFVSRTGGAYYVPGDGRRAFSSNTPRDGYVATHRRLPYDGFMPVLAESLTRPVAVLGSLTITPHPSYGRGSGFVVTYAAGSSRPDTVDLSYSAAQIAQTGNLMLTRLGRPADVGIDNAANNVAETVDVSGAFVLPAPDPTPEGVYGWRATTGSFPASRVDDPGGIRQIAGNLFDVTVLRTDGTVETWDNHISDPPERTINGRRSVPGLREVSSIARTNRTSFALRGTTVYSWGSNTYGLLGTGTGATSTTTPGPITGLPPVTALGTGTYNGYAIDTAGSLWGWGDNSRHQIDATSTESYREPVRIAVPAPVVAVSGTTSTQYAVTADGDLYKWGGTLAEPVQVTEPCPLTSVLAARDGAEFLALCDNGDLVLHQRRTSGGFVSIARTESAYHYALLRSDGTVWLTSGNTVSQVPDLSGIDVIGYAGSWNAAINNPD